MDTCLSVRMQIVVKHALTYSRCQSVTHPKLMVKLVTVCYPIAILVTSLGVKTTMGLAWDQVKGQVMDQV